MQYSVIFSHIDKDFGFDDLYSGKWNADYDNEEDFVFALNRMAIASSQYVVIDFPEIEVCAKNARVTIRAINGQLFYTDLHSQNRKDLKVVPIEVVRLIDGQPLEEVFKQEVEEAFELPPRKDRIGTRWFAKTLAFVLMLAILSVCSKVIWEDINSAPRLHSAPMFIPSFSEESEVLRKYADVYVSEHREGAMLFELTREGSLHRYEMWHSEERNGFVLVPVDTYRVHVGLHLGEIAMLAGEVYLLEPQGEEIISLHGIQYHRHPGKLASIGEVLHVKRD